MVNIKIWVKVLRDKAFEIASNPKYDGYQRRSTPMVSKFCNKKSTDSGINSISISINSLQMNSINQLLEYLKEWRFIHHFKTIFFFLGGVGGGRGGRDLADMQLIS